ncbi:MAG: hypothetical protein SNF33_02615 [Candidatus Algichlamydia australiensis]|nr:hypothetical protein [Chlamydiales bacterium]
MSSFGISISHHPEVAIIGIEAIEKEVVAHDDDSFGAPYSSMSR